MNIKLFNNIVYLAFFMVMYSLSNPPLFSQSKQSDRFFTLGIQSYESGNYNKAIEFFTKADALDQKELPKESSRNLYSQSWIAYCYFKLGNLSKAKEINRYQYYFLPPDRRITLEADKYADLAYKALAENNLNLSLEYALKSIDIEKDLLGRESLSYAGSCALISSIYSQLRDYDNSLIFCEEGLDVLRGLGLQNDPITFQLLQGRVYANLAKNLVALTFSDIANLNAIARIEESEYGDKYPYSIVKMLEARIDIHRGDFDRAGELAKKAFWTLIDLYDPNNEELFMSISDCLTELELTEHHDILPSVLNEALPILKNKHLSSEHHGMILSWLGDFSYDVESSIDYHSEAARLLKNAKNQDWYYSNQCMLAGNYADNNEIRTAIQLYNEVIQHYENADSLNGAYRNALMNLGDLYYALGDGEKAGCKYRKILSILKNHKDGVDYKLTFMKWIPIYVAECRSDNREPSWNDGFELGSEMKNVIQNMNFSEMIDNGIGIVQISSAIFPFYNLLVSEGTINPYFSWQKIEQDISSFVYNILIPKCTYKNQYSLQGLSLLAHIEYLLGNNDKAISIIKQVIENSKDCGWTFDNNIHDLAYYQYANGEIEEAYPNFRTGYNYLKDELLKRYRWMTLEERTNYTNVSRGNLDNLAHYSAITPNDSRYAQLGYDALLFTKGLLLNSSIELVRLVQEEGDNETIKLLDEWRRINQSIEAAKVSVKNNIDNLSSKANSIEKQLIERSKSFGDYTTSLSISWQDVQSALSPNDIAVELCSYQKNAFSRQYGAIVLTKSKSPYYVDLGNDYDWIHNFGSPKEYLKTNLFEQIFANLIPSFPEKSKGNIYLSPEGIFHTIPIESMPGSEPFNIRRVSSTRELAINDGVPVKISSAVLFGGIKYGLGKLASFYQSSDSGRRNNEGFLNELPRTLQEINNIRGVMSGKIKIEYKSSENASKTNFQSYSGKKYGILHIATHGFFDANRSNDIKMDPMLLSGLYFAGAQNTLWNIDTKKLIDNGILTAKEISSLDFRGVNLVVLSACDTGRGIINSDGVFGLQRAFKQAGVKSILMSLWDVADDVTEFLMSKFYCNLFDGMNQYDSLKRAQIDAKRVFPESDDWAAFVLIDANKNILF